MTVLVSSGSRKFHQNKATKIATANVTREKGKTEEVSTGIS
jgi:hypothetical protein